MVMRKWALAGDGAAGTPNPSYNVKITWQWWNAKTHADKAWSTAGSNPACHTNKKRKK